MKRLAFLAAVLALLARPILAASCSPTTFVTAATYAAQPVPTAIAVADFNGDGFQDIAALHSGYPSSTVLVFLGNPDGTFQPPIATSAPDNASSLVAGQFNAGPDVDLVLGRYDGAIETLLGNGDGSFQPAIVSPPGPPVSFYAIAAANLDTDANLDIVGVGGGAVAVLLGNGDGTFAAPVAYPTFGSASSVAVGDIDEDGAVDLVTVGGGNALTILLGAGDGSFGLPSSVAVGQHLLDVHLSDLSLDGHLDIAVVTNDEYVAVLIGDGDGTFHAPRDYPAGPSPVFVGVGDFDGDGKPDLAAASGVSYPYSSSLVWLLPGNGDGTFREGARFVSSGGLTAFAVADFGASPSSDVALLNNSERPLAVMIGNGDGTLQAVRAVPTDLPANQLASGDFNGDGRPDLAAASSSYGSNSIQILIADAQGGFYSLPAPSLPESPATLGAGDFTGDGYVDLLITAQQASYLLPGNGDGTFQAPSAIPLDGYSNSMLTIADFNGDGRLDFAVAPLGGSGGNRLEVFLGNGDGTFQSPILSPLDGNPNSSVAGDFNGDGRLDVALVNGTCCGSANTVSVLLGQGDGSFGPAANFATGTNPTSIAAAAFGFGSNDLDLVVANAGDWTVSFLRGNGDGTFQDQILIGSAWAPQTIVAGDLDGDGLADIATANILPGSASVLQGLGDGKFRSAEYYPVGSSPFPMLIVDLFGNGTPDVVVGNEQGVSLLVNPHLAAAPLLPAGTCEGSGGNIRVLAGGFGPVTYQWRKDGVPLAEVAPFSGVTTPVLIISPATTAEDGDYDVVLTDSCASTTSTTTSFTVDARPPQPSVVIAPTVPPGTPGLTASVATPAPGHTYAWALSGAVITAGQGTSEVTFATLLPGELIIAVTDYAVPGCGSDSLPLTIPIDYLDVPPSNPFHDDIVTVAQAGITAGCGGGNYCPIAPVTRAQMAVFLLKAKFGAAHVPPVSSQLFNDVPPGSFAYDWINELANDGITSGCGSGDYCPDGSVTRAQMAVFLLKTLVGSYYDPPFGPQVFDDVPQYSFAANYIADIYVRGITGGCSATPLLYCPDSPVNRGQMAALLVRTFLTP